MVMLIQRIIKLIRSEGFISFLKKTFATVAERILWFQTYYVSEINIQELSPDPVSNQPEINNLSHQLIHSNQEADSVSDRYEDFRPYFTNSRQRLNNGAIAQCLYVDNEVGHIIWIALNESAKKSFNDLPYKVNFDNKEMCIGGALTTPNHRGKGLSTYATHLRNRYLKGKGITKKIAVIKVGNMIPLRLALSMENRVTTKAYYMRLLGLKIWKEVPIDTKDIKIEDP